VDRLSGGNRQRVNIAVGLLADPPVLALDEPSSSLDPRQRERLWRFIAGLSRRGRCVLFSTHNVAEAERYAQQVLVLADGELLFSGSPREFESIPARPAHIDPDSTREARIDPDSTREARIDPDSTREAHVDSDPARPDFEAAFVEFLRERGH
jgi:ABC-type multidrug transport system ATPase subunit